MIGQTVAGVRAHFNVKVAAVTSVAVFAEEKCLVKAAMNARTKMIDSPGLPKISGAP